MPKIKKEDNKKEVKIIPVVTKVHAIQCYICCDIIYSCANHDFKFCTCGSCFIDGGFDYCRIGGEPKQILNTQLMIPASKQQLYDDWNNSNTKPRKYGCVKLIS